MAKHPLTCPAEVRLDPDGMIVIFRKLGSGQDFLRFTPEEWAAVVRQVEELGRDKPR